VTLFSLAGEIASCRGRESPEWVRAFVAGRRLDTEGGVVPGVGCVMGAEPAHRGGAGRTGTFADESGNPIGETEGGMGGVASEPTGAIASRPAMASGRYRGG
jgi:hypothetical protein